MYSISEKPNNAPVNIWVKPVRRDGKHLVTLCFHARKLRKVMTPAQIDEYRDNPKYRVIAS